MCLKNIGKYIVSNEVPTKKQYKNIMIKMWILILVPGIIGMGISALAVWGPNETAVIVGFSLTVAAYLVLFINFIYLWIRYHSLILNYRFHKKNAEALGTDYEATDIEQDKNLLKDVLLNLTKDILNLCDATLEENSSPNIEVVKIIKNEFQEQLNCINEGRKILVLNKQRDLWAARTIVDSADLGYDNKLFEMVFRFASLSEKVPEDEVLYLYDR